MRRWEAAERVALPVPQAIQEQLLASDVVAFVVDLILARSPMPGSFSLSFCARPPSKPPSLLHQKRKNARQDVVSDGDIQEKVLGAAQRSEDGFFTAPRVVDK